MNENSTCAVCNRVYISEGDFLTGTSRWRVCSMGHLWFNCSCGSTLLVKKGKYPWYSPEKFMSEEAKGIFNTLGNLKNLPHIPNSIMQLQQTLEDPEVSARDIANHLKNEPVMATQLLKIAENMRKSRNPQNPPIQSLEHAIVYMGLKSVKDMVVAASLKTFKIPPSKFNIDDYWTESFLTGSVTEYLAKKFAISLPEDQLFLAGSLCNVGKLVLATCFSSLINKIIMDINSPDTLANWQLTEQKYKFPNHAILGEIAAALWGLPDFVMVAARKHHEPYISKGPQIELWEVVSAANQFSHWLLLQPHRMEQKTLEDFMNRFSLKDKDLEQLVKEMEPLKQHVLSSRLAS